MLMPSGPARGVIRARTWSDRLALVQLLGNQTELSSARHCALPPVLFIWLIYRGAKCGAAEAASKKQSLGSTGIAKTS